jgi:FixJ family two-component response regulator
MPGLNGLDLQQRLASLDATLPIIFISGRIDPSTRVKALTGGALDFLAKPVDAETLLPCVQRAIEASASTAILNSSVKKT